MQPPEPTTQDTSLELPSEPSAEALPAAPSELELPPSAPPPLLPADVAPSQPESPSGPLGDLVVAHFRRVEIAMLGQVLITTLAGSLPASMLRVERRRSLGTRLLKRSGDLIGITITAGERTLTFRATGVGTVEASIGHVVRGIMLSNTPVPIAQWLAELGDVLEQLTRDDEAARGALERALLS